MSDIKLSELTSEIELSNGDFQLTESVDAIRQHLSQRLRTFLGEWFLDTTTGVPYYEKILVKNPIAQVIEETLVTVILGTPGVLELTSLELDLDGATRTLRVDFSVRSTDGPINFSELLPVGG